MGRSGAILWAAPYELWKRSLFEEFLGKKINSNSHVLEIGPGHGRWMELYVKKVKQVSVVDLTPECIEFCRRKFSSLQNISYFINDGKSLRDISNQSIDFIWSYDVFVHVDPEDLRAYLKEFHRVLKPGGLAVIHHSHRSLWSRFIKKTHLHKLPFIGEKLNRETKSKDCGWRSWLDKKLVQKFIKESNLKLLNQTCQWEPNGEYDCKLFDDVISIIHKE